ncbi:23S rRNA (adenine(2030)-N(6))-methyltransferase RlmJ [Marinicauda salina]|uniref:Ribosomal RNA large subunit methyltransferase J n=1 Tax=Marinicauda salina TaxID=2135793 RepID=A0A2U2BRV0_9PROT|nr:23S rRNA (adenine(2030)-N(6))-methyltransferase RlmJ [Marinicauda salina]PWE16708.1 23S rRNA (adenine(2030)-N(6))-methyltransferase RlmJ [Marinicauda salina]
MTYRHADHAGNFADVLKHVVLAQCLQHLRKKDKPCAVIDTHAGRGVYELAPAAAPPRPEWVDGVRRVLDAERPEDVERVLAAWLDAVRAADPDGGLAIYPGSPAIAAHLMRDTDRLHLCETDEDAAAALDARYAKDRRVKVETRDGFKAIAALVPPKEKRGLVLVDPGFADPDEMAWMAEAAAAAIPKWPTGTYVFWRPLTDIWAAERFDVGLAEWLIAEQGFAPEKILRADLWVRDLDVGDGLAGAGVVVINPPFTLEADLLAALPWLAETLAQGEGAGWRLDGAFTEESLTTEEF